MAKNLGPLTTTFSPPASCFNTFYRNYKSDPVKLLDAPECFPTDFVSTGFYSPAFFCPSGYAANLANNNGIETSINCCPSQYQFSGPWPGACITSRVSTTVTVRVTGYPTDGRTFIQLYSNPTVGPLWASAIQLRFRDSDLTTTTPSLSSSSISSSISSSSPASSPSSSPSSSISSNSPSSSPASISPSNATSSPSSSPLTPTSISTSTSNASGLSTLAKIGVGVAIPVAVTAILAALAGLYI